MRPIQRIRFAAEDTGRFVLFFDKGEGGFAFIVVPFDQNAPMKLAPYLSIAAVAFMMPPDSNAIVDIFEDPKHPVTLSFYYEVFHCVNAYTTRLTAGEIDALGATGLEGECGCECPVNSGLWAVTICEDPIGTNATCGANGVECI